MRAVPNYRSSRYSHLGYNVCLFFLETIVMENLRMQILPLKMTSGIYYRVRTFQCRHSARRPSSIFLSVTLGIEPDMFTDRLRGCLLTDLIKNL